MALSAQIFNLNKTVVPHLTSSMIKHALRLEDEVVIHPFRHQARSLRLNRTKYEIHGADTYRKGQYGAQLWLPTLPSDAGKTISLQLMNVRCHDSGEIHSVYEAVSDIPFRLNGQWTNRAPLRKGDIVDMGFIRFCFEKAELLKTKHGINELVVKSNLPILIEGETGSGKTTLAQDIHDRSGVLGRFIHLNLSAFSPSLVESELFGHIKGAFTGAHRDKTGALSMAHGGTLFLDEIDSLSKELQTKLLLFLDSGVVRPVGGTSERKVKTRLIFASGTNLSTRVKMQDVRADFYHRLCSGVKVVLPSLREDKNLLEKVINDFSIQFQRGICPSLVAHYARYSWPGNIRELKGHLYKKHVLNPVGVLRFDEHDEELILGHNLSQLSDQGFATLRELKARYMDFVLARVDYNIANAAKILGVSENTVRKVL